MSMQYINFEDEILDSDTPQYFIDNGNIPNSKTINLANTIVNEGTEVNKVLFDKIDDNFEELYNTSNYNGKDLTLIKQYNKLHSTKEYIDSEWCSNFTVEDFDEENAYNGQRVLLSPLDMQQGGIEYFGSSSSSPIMPSGGESRNVVTVPLSNNNFMIFMYSYNGAVFSSMYAIKTETGSTVTSATIGTNLVSIDAKSLSNGNVIALFDSSDSHAATKFCIYSEDGTKIKSMTNLKSNYLYPKILELSNGNIIISGHHSSGDYHSFTILSQDGDFIVNNVDINQNLTIGDIQETTDNKILIFYGNSTDLFVDKMNLDGSNIVTTALGNGSDSFSNVKTVNLVITIYLYVDIVMLIV